MAMREQDNRQIVAGYGRRDAQLERDRPSFDREDYGVDRDRLAWIADRDEQGILDEIVHVSDSIWPRPTSVAG